MRACGYKYTVKRKKLFLSIETHLCELIKSKIMIIVAPT
jgi:hypothetical protein